MSHHDSESQRCTCIIINAHIWEILDSFPLFTIVMHTLRYHNGPITGIKMVKLSF